MSFSARFSPSPHRSVTHMLYMYEIIHSVKKLNIYEFSQSITTLELWFKSNLFFLSPSLTSFHNSSRSTQNYCRALNGIMLEKTSSEKIAKRHVLQWCMILIYFLACRTENFFCCSTAHWCEVSKKCINRWHLGF